MTETESAFDTYALSYDGDFTHSSVGVLQRKRVWRYLRKQVMNTSISTVLEVNGGTGEDALWLTNQGYAVTVTDLSTEMVGVAKEKLHGKNAVVFQCNILDIASKLQGKKFDMIFSNFGGLNCLSPEELKGLSEKFSELLHPGGRLVFVIMGRNCKWEQWYFKRKNDLESAFRRRSKDGVEAVIFDQKFSTYYYSPEEMGTFFISDFKVVNFKPIGIALPPSYLDNYFKKHKSRLGILKFLENIFGNFSFLADNADHYIIELTRKNPN